MTCITKRLLKAEQFELILNILYPNSYEKVDLLVDDVLVAVEYLGGKCHERAYDAQSVQKQTT